MNNQQPPSYDEATNDTPPPYTYAPPTYNSTTRQPRMQEEINAILNAPNADSLSNISTVTQQTLKIEPYPLGPDGKLIPSTVFER